MNLNENIMNLKTHLNLKTEHLKMNSKTEKTIIKKLNLRTTLLCKLALLYDVSY